MKKKLTKEEKAVERVMRAFKNGRLKSSSGELVTDRAQALAIAMSEAGENVKKSEDLIKNISINTLDEAQDILKSIDCEILEKAKLGDTKDYQGRTYICITTKGGKLGWRLQNKNDSKDVVTASSVSVKKVNGKDSKDEKIDNSRDFKTKIYNNLSDSEKKQVDRLQQKLEKIEEKYKDLSKINIKNDSKDSQKWKIYYDGEDIEHNIDKNIIDKETAEKTGLLMNKEIVPKRKLGSTDEIEKFNSKDIRNAILSLNNIEVNVKDKGDYFKIDFDNNDFYTHEKISKKILQIKRFLESTGASCIILKNQIKAYKNK